MDKQSKELLLKDLCARLPYGVKIKFNDGTDDVYNLDGNIHGRFTENVMQAIDDLELKPYLRPMSSMTEEELKEFIDVVTWQEADGTFHIDKCQDISFYQEKYDWLNAHHFDYRCLIEKDLALPASEGMYDFK